MSTRGQPAAPWRTSEDKTALQTSDLTQDRMSEPWTQTWNERDRRNLLLEGFNTKDNELWAVTSCLNRKESLKMMYLWENRKNQSSEAPWETYQLWHINSILPLWRYESLQSSKDLQVPFYHACKFFQGTSYLDKKIRKAEEEMPNEILDGQTLRKTKSCYSILLSETLQWGEKECFSLDIFQSLRKDYRDRSIYLHSPILSAHRSGGFFSHPVDVRSLNYLPRAEIK